MPDKPEIPIAERKHEFRCPDGELDEVFIANASVHIERMDDTAFWIGIEGEGKPPLMLNTGIHRGMWYFNIEVDSLEHPEFLSVQRPRKGTIEAPRRKAHDVERISTLAHQLSQEKERLKGGPTQPCGHSIIWEIRSAETFEVLYCDICNMRSELRDALQMEAHYKAENTRLTEALREEEQNHELTIGQRDAAEETLSAIYLRVTRHEAIWSNLFGYNEALNDICAVVARAEAECERLGKPVSDEEEKLWAQELTAEQTWAFSKGSIFNLLAARRTQEREEQGG